MTTKAKPFKEKFWPTKDADMFSSALNGVKVSFHWFKGVSDAKPALFHLHCFFGVKW